MAKRTLQKTVDRYLTHGDIKTLLIYQRLREKNAAVGFENLPLPVKRSLKKILNEMGKEEVIPPIRVKQTYLRRGESEEAATEKE